MEKTKLYLKLSKIPLDILAILFAFPQSYLLRYSILPDIGLEKAGDFYLSFASYITQLSGLIPLAFLLLIANRAYPLSRGKSLLSQIRTAAYSAVLLTFITIFYYFLSRTYPPSRLVVFYYSAFLFINLLSIRLLIFGIKKVLLNYGFGKTKIIIIGNNKIANKVIGSLAKSDNFQIIGYIADRSTKIPYKWLGKYERAQQIIKKHNASSIIQTESSPKFDTESGLNIARKLHLEYQYVPSDYNLHKHKFIVSNLEGIPWLKWEKTTLEGWGRIYKRCFDIVISTFGIIILAPLFAIVAILIKLDSKGPIFFRLKNGRLSKRVGYQGTQFSFFKFRSMQHETHNQRYDKLIKNNKRKGPLVKINNDPRVTKVGKWIRRFDIDELPQLINVIKGNMSIVGPRPHLPEEVAKYDDNDHFVFTIKPGITGLAQASGRSNLSFADEVVLDSYYIEHWSPLLDFKIILKTIPAVIFKKQD